VAGTIGFGAPPRMKRVEFTYVSYFQQRFRLFLITVVHAGARQRSWVLCVNPCAEGNGSRSTYFTLEAKCFLDCLRVGVYSPRNIGLTSLN
jgi:hypothetical protein